MKIDIVGEIEFRDLANKIRGVPLMGKRDDGSSIYVYENANISLKELKVNEINPTSFYVLKNNMEFQRNLRSDLLKMGIDTLHLKKAYEIKNEKGEIWTLTPPIIEVTQRDVKYIPREGELKYGDVVRVNVPIINDGMHRVNLARELNETFNAIYISRVPEEYPFYAHPNEWSKVKEYEEVPSSKLEKKFYSRENCYNLYRDFGTIGCGAPRGTSK